MKKWIAWISLGFGLVILLAIAFNTFIYQTYWTSRWGVKQYTDQVGAVIYEHQDPGTTEFLEVYMGKREFNSHVRLEYVKWHLTELDEFQSLLDKGYWQGTPEQLRRDDGREVLQILKQIDEKARKAAKETAKDYGYYLSEVRPYQRSAIELQKKYLNVEKDEFDQDAYEKFWQALIKSGNPRIEVVEEANWINPKKKAFYAPWNNTIYVEPNNLNGNLVQELSHARQFHYHPYWSAWSFLGYFVYSGVLSLIPDKETFALKYDLGYHREGSFEYEAHEKYQPQIEIEMKPAESKSK